MYAQELQQEDINEISRLVADGFISGQLDNEDGSMVVWVLTIKKINNDN